MAITFDKALGSRLQSGGASATITTVNAAASGSRVVVCFSYFLNPVAGTPSCTVGGTTATLDKQFTNGSDIFVVFSLVVGGGLASSSSIVCTPGGTTGLGGELCTACSYLGTTGVDTTATNATTGTGFSSGAAANSVADALFVGGAGNETALTSVGTVNSNGTPRFDIWDTTDQQGMRMLDVIASSIGSQALTGSWGSTGTQSSTNTTGVLVIYKGTAAAAAGGPFGNPNLPFMAPQGGIL